MATNKISQYTVNPNESYFFDTNVWMILFAPIAGAKQHKQNMYSKLFGEILSRKAMIWINSQVVAEYINGYLRLEFENWKNANSNGQVDFKHVFRQTGDYIKALEEAKSQIFSILQKCQRHPDDFNAVDVNAILSSMGKDIDYGDAIIVDLCSRKKFNLVTDDKDITNISLPVTVITA